HRAVAGRPSHWWSDPAGLNTRRRPRAPLSSRLLASSTTPSSPRTPPQATSCVSTARFPFRMDVRHSTGPGGEGDPGLSGAAGGHIGWLERLDPLLRVQRADGHLGPNLRGPCLSAGSKPPSGRAGAFRRQLRREERWPLPVLHPALTSQSGLDELETQYMVAS